MLTWTKVLNKFWHLYTTKNVLSVLVIHHTRKKLQNFKKKEIYETILYVRHFGFAYMATEEKEKEIFWNAESCREGKSKIIDIGSNYITHKLFTSMFNVKFFFTGMSGGGGGATGDQLQG